MRGILCLCVTARLKIVEHYWFGLLSSRLHCLHFSTLCSIPFIVTCELWPIFNIILFMSVRAPRWQSWRPSWGILLRDRPVERSWVSQWRSWGRYWVPRSRWEKEPDQNYSVTAMKPQCQPEKKEKGKKKITPKNVVLKEETIVYSPSVSPCSLNHFYVDQNTPIKALN